MEEALLADLDRLWDQIKGWDRVAVENALVELLPGIVDAYGAAYAEVAALWFEQLVGSSPVVGSPDRREAVTRSVRYALRPYLEGAALGVVQSRVASVVLRHARQAGRDVIDDSVRATPGVRYARRLTGTENCDFCVILASRGPVYGTELDAGGWGNRYHDDCDCEPVPVRGQWRPDSDSPRGVSWDGENPGYDFEELYLDEYRPYWRPGDKITDVTRRRRDARPAGRPGRPKGSKNKKPKVATGAGGGGKKPPVIPSVEGMDVPEWLTDRVLDKIMNGVIWVDRSGKAILHGGHKHGKGWLNKTEFPESWTTDDVRKAIILTWNKPDAVRFSGDRRETRKIIDGVVVHVSAYGRHYDRFIAAYPLGGAGVRENRINKSYNKVIPPDWNDKRQRWQRS
ncbi:Uncharacterised protein [Trueperella bialowiezensis]|uniref:Bacterial EndoU nuclease domain-containing protein n=1 Tax=Trueperella bialowiezensis TaxID=312285 RepID=A0A3S4WG85_9ACTO|nr:Uncharacterised protein [Trueperella bialowiezensis]